MTKRAYVDPTRAERCTFDITLKDGSGARCGRRASKDGRCWQHPHRDLDAREMTELRAVFFDGKDCEPEHFWKVCRLIDEVERRRKATP